MSGELGLHPVFAFVVSGSVLLNLTEPPWWSASIGWLGTTASGIIWLAYCDRTRGPS
ncbi:hypothetical protein AB0I60_36355 [Actinosynnema sp. NPDC050436]|uniref:hypothetical protein n=1 Tax=Actinosynnema sp. NPDC050436 TaxID=3155659 RepID=UPI0033D3BD16